MTVFFPAVVDDDVVEAVLLQEIHTYVISHPIKSIEGATKLRMKLYLTLLFLLSAAELSVALMVGLASSCDCELRLPLALPPFVPSFVVHVEDGMTLLLRILWALLASLAAGEVDERKALG